jgi:flagellin-like hook-associated protein FlgL
MANSVERLSSGLRINRARDDAAGLGISNALTQQINSADQGIRNLNDGISIVQTAEGAITQASEMAQRILTLAVQGQSSALSQTQKNSITTEMRSMLDGINAIQTRTKFGGNTTALFNGSSISIYSSKETLDTISITSAALTTMGTASGGLAVTLSGAVTASTTLAVTGITTVSNKILPNVTGTIDIGATGTKFGNVHANYLVGTSVTAQYADLAERFEADNVYSPGTVVELGGAKEITRAVQELSESVFDTKINSLNNENLGILYNTVVSVDKISTEKKNN